MNKKLYKDMDTKTYESLRKILNYDEKRLILLSKKRRKVFIEELDALQKIDNIRIIKYLLVFCFDKDIAIAIKALNHLKRIVDNLTMKELLFFAEYFRSTYYYYTIDSEIEKSYREADKYRCNLINRFEDESIYILLLLTLHPNGYIREDALNQLSQTEDSSKIKFIMLRVNDWVKEVRLIAKKELKRCIKDEYLEDIIKCLPIIDRMNDWGRDDYADILLELEGLIVNQKNYNLILGIYKESEERLVKRKLFRYLMRINTISHLVIDIGLKSNDIIILRTAIEKIDDIINEDNSQLIISALKKNKNAVCRVAAIDVLEKMNIVNFEKYLTPFLYDKSFKVRDYTRYKLRKLGITNLREMYLRELDKNNCNLYAGILGIKEIGIKEDTRFIINHISHHSIKIRKAALTTIYKLNPEEGTQYALEKLTSEYIGESNIARRCLENDILLLDENKIYELFEIEGYDIHVYFNLIKLMNHYPKWITIIQLLKMLNISSSTHVKTINDEIEVWINKFNRSFTTPRKEQVSSIRKLLMTVDDKLGSNNRIALLSIIKRY